MSEGREWYPADWVDEVCPPSKQSPEAFIVSDCDRRFLGYDGTEKGSPAIEDGWLNRPLTPCDVINFVYCDRLGDIEATLRRDGSYVLHTGTIPPEHNVVIVDGDTDTLHESFDALIDAIKKSDDDWFDVKELIFRDDEQETRVTLSFAYWSDPEPYIFEVIDGRAAFRLVPAQKH